MKEHEQHAGEPVPDPWEPEQPQPVGPEIEREPEPEDG